MSSALPLGSIGGIKIRLHWTWGIIFALVSWSLAIGYFPQHFKHWSALESWLVAIAAAIFLFVSVLIHELAHSFVARRQGLPVDSITLYLFGGASSLTREPDTVGEEFWMAIAGPLSSVGLGVLFLGLYVVTPGPAWLAAIFGYLGSINLLLAIFNLIPAFPLDGGRVLRSLAWGATHDLNKATQIAVTVSRFLALGLILFGILNAFFGNIIGGIWIALIGWFLYNAATASGAQAGERKQFERIRAGDVMAPSPQAISPEDRLDRAVYDRLLHQPERTLPVADDGRLVGMLTAADVRQFPPEQWPVIGVHRAMTPINQVDTIGPETPLADALKLMTEHQRDEVPVVEDGHIVGLLSRSGLAHYVLTKRELGLPV